MNAEDGERRTSGSTATDGRFALALLDVADLEAITRLSGTP